MLNEDKVKLMTRMAMYEQGRCGRFQDQLILQKRLFELSYHCYDHLGYDWIHDRSGSRRGCIYGCNSGEP